MASFRGKLWPMLALAAILGANLGLWQGVAWTSMLAANLRSQSMGEAMTRTFDGRHLCPLCRAIAAARQSQNKSPVTSSPRLEFFAWSEPAPWVQPPAGGRLAAPVHPLQSLRREPPVPPPRTSQA